MAVAHGSVECVTTERTAIRRNDGRPILHFSVLRHPVTLHVVINQALVFTVGLCFFIASGVGLRP
jgi:hypothetical protein